MKITFSDRIDNEGATPEGFVGAEVINEIKGSVNALYDEKADSEAVQSLIQDIELTPGPQGLQGPKGDVGPQGLKGDKGDTGPQGPAGMINESEYVHTSEDEIITGVKTFSDGIIGKVGGIDVPAFKTDYDSLPAKNITGTQVSTLQSIKTGNPLLVRVELTADQNIDNNIGKVINLDKVVYDPNGYWDATKKRMQIPVSGMYKFVMQQRFAPTANGGARAIQYYKCTQSDYSDEQLIATDQLSYTPNSGSWQKYLESEKWYNAGEYVYAKCWQSSGAILALTATSTFISYLEIYKGNSYFK